MDASQFTAQRTRLGLSQAAIATALGVDQATISRWESGKVRILGSSALECALVGAGVAHGALTINGKLWDVVAPAAVALEAGALLTDLAGVPVFPFNLTGYNGVLVSSAFGQAIRAMGPRRVQLSAGFSF